jgi:nitrate/nitrite-specific signal transduction histidine kinase
MARREEAPRLEDFPQMQAAFKRTQEALDSISQLIGERLTAATSQASRASSRIGTAATSLALLLGVALILSSTLAFLGVVKPLEDLRRATGRLRAGDLSARAPVRGVRAVAQLASRFNESAAEMESLLQRLEQRVAARTAQLTALESLSRAGLTQLDRDALLRIVVERMASAAGADAADLRLTDEGTLSSVARHGLPEPRPGLGNDDPLRGRVLGLRRSRWVEDLGPEGEVAGLRDLGFRSVVDLPLLVRERPLGVASLLFRERRKRDPELLRVLEAMAARAALALERAEMVQEVVRHAEDLQAANQRLIETQERLVEAERLAAVAQIHIALRHEINNPLSVLVGAAEILRHCPDDPEVVREWVACLRQATDRIVDVMRRLEGLRRVETTDYVEGITMVDLRRTGEGRQPGGGSRGE